MTCVVGVVLRALRIASSLWKREGLVLLEVHLVVEVLIVNLGREVEVTCSLDQHASL